MAGIRETWGRLAAFQMDHATVGIVWGAHDRQNNVFYVYDCAVRPRGDLAVLAATFRDKGSWIPVLYDHLRGDEEDGIRTAQRLADLGTEIFTARTSAEAAATEMQVRLSTGRMIVADHLEPWFAEYRRYRRDEKGEIISADTHLMGATGLMVIHLGLAITEAKATSDRKGFDVEEYNLATSGSLTGY